MKMSSEIEVFQARLKISSENLKFSSVQARLIFFKIRALWEEVSPLKLFRLYDLSLLFQVLLFFLHAACRNLVARIARCHRDARCDSNRTPPNRWRRERVFASDAKTHPLDLKSKQNARKKSLRKFCDVGLRCEKSGCFLSSSDVKWLRFGLPLRLQLACNANTCDAKSLAMRVERCEPLSAGR